MKNRSKIQPRGWTGEVPVWCSHSSLEPIDSLKPNPRNYNLHPDKQIAALAKVIAGNGWRYPIVVSKRSGLMTKGHARLRVAKLLQLPTVPVDFQDYETAEDEMADLIADNKIAELAEPDRAALSTLISELDTGAFNMERIGMLAPDIEELMTAAPPEGAFFDVSGDQGGAKALKDDMEFPTDLRFGFPPLLDDMLATCPEPITTWCGHDATEACEHYFYNIHTDSVRGLDLTKAVIGFYTDDYRFDGAWENTAEFVGRIINRHPLSCVTPNWSTYTEWPEAMKIWSVYRSRWVGRYMQEAGLKIIPDVPWINNIHNQVLDWWTVGLPVNAPCLSMEVQTGTKNEIDKLTVQMQMSLILKELKPQSMLIYHGPLGRELLEPKLPKSFHVIWLESRSVKRSRIMKPKKLKA